jgi:hypothetical protein
MRDRLTLAHVLACFSISLVGCSTTREQPSVVPSYTLSSSEIEAVVTGIRSVTKDLDGPTFTGFRAAQRADGRIAVCGWMSPTRNSEQHPFVGILSGGKFTPGQIGGQPFDDAAILSECRTRGAGLF